MLGHFQKVIWNKESSQNIINKKWVLKNLWMDDKMSIVDFMRKVIDLLNQLVRIDESPLLCFVEQIFNPLPKSYDGFVKVDSSEK